MAFAGLAALLLAAAGAASSADGEQPAGPAPWNVVLIRSWDSLYPVNLSRESAMRDAILDKAPRPIEFYPEEIDPLRFPMASERQLAAALGQKYRDTHIDIVIASSIEPLEFATRHRDTIWPGAAIVFSGVFEGGLENWTRPPKTTGVMVQLDVEGTLALGRALVPGARKLYVVSGAASFDGRLRDLALEQLQSLAPPLEVHRIDGVGRDEAAAEVAALGSDALVLYLTMLRDASGRISGPNTPAMSVVAARSRVPVLSLIQTQFRRGPVGGSAPRYDLHGRVAGELVRRVLQGADPDLIPIRADPAPTCEVDWNGLDQWGIPRANVPSACRIVNLPPELSRTYLYQVLALVLVVLLQSALLGALVLQSRRRRRAETQLHARGAELAQVTRLSMIGALTASIAHEINQPMGAILSNAEAAEMMLEQKTLDPEKLKEILADIRNEDLRASEVIRGLRSLLAKREWHPVPLEVNAEVAEALHHVAFDAARNDVRLAPVFGRAMPSIMGESVQLQQVVINLVMNAMQALAEVAPAMREVRVETLTRPGGVEILVADHGPGLAPGDAARIFDAPFTTKKDGMGFGLSIVRSIVDMHRGRVTYEPNVPRGAIFRVWLPAIGK